MLFTTGLPGFMHSMSKSAVVAMGTGGVMVTGITVYLALKVSMSGNLPSTLNPEWKRATIKYRAAQVQDPITK